MKILVIGLIALIASYTSAITCPTYECAKDMETPKGCALETLESVKLRVCGEDKEFCPIRNPPLLDEEITCVPKETVAMLYPGEYCEKSGECLSNNCVGNKCKGDAEEEKCTKDATCNAGLYCNGTHCVKTALPGASCLEGVRCDPRSICYNGNCTLFASLANNDASSIPALCKSYYVRNGKCAPGPKLAKEFNKTCTGETCNYDIEGEKEPLEGPCVCGRSTQINGYCQPGKGDVSLEQVIFSFS